MTAASLKKIVEEALAECGVESRRQWRKLAGMRQLAFRGRT